MQFAFIRWVGSVDPGLAPLELAMGLVGAQLYLGANWARYVIGGWLALMAAASAFGVVRSPGGISSGAGAGWIALSLGATVIAATLIVSKSVSGFLRLQRERRSPRVPIAFLVLWILAAGAFCVWIILDLLREWR